MFWPVLFFRYSVTLYRVASSTSISHVLCHRKNRSMTTLSLNQPASSAPNRGLLVGSLYCRHSGHAWMTSSISFLIRSGQRNRSTMRSMSGLSACQNFS